MQLISSHMGIQITTEERASVHSSVTICSQGIYFKRTYIPNEATIVYFAKYLSSVLQKTEQRIVIADYQENDPLTASQRRIMVQNVKPILSELDVIIFVLNPERKGLQRVMIEFFVKAYLRQWGITIYFGTSKREAFEILASLKSTNQT